MFILRSVAVRIAPPTQALAVFSEAYQIRLCSSPINAELIGTLKIRALQGITRVTLLDRAKGLAYVPIATTTMMKQCRKSFVHFQYVWR